MVICHRNLIYETRFVFYSSVVFENLRVFPFQKLFLRLFDDVNVDFHFRIFKSIETFNNIMFFFVYSYNK